MKGVFWRGWENQEGYIQTHLKNASLERAVFAVYEYEL